MKETCKIYKILPPTSGVSKFGEQFASQTVVVESAPDRFGKTYKLALEAFGAFRVSAISTFSEGDLVVIDFVVNSREYQGRWYTTARLMNITPAAPLVPSDTGEDLPEL